MTAHDPFTGTWIFNPERSTLSTPPPQSWVQEIHATALTVEVEETIASQDGLKSVVTVRARSDGQDYPVIGSAVVDSIAYQRESLRIIGTGKKNGAISIRETVVVSDEILMTLTYAIFVGNKEVATGIAIFERA
ncbi:hypothetical protein [Tunturiibacter psychrotolerans]|uniref:hypothetical protein n=1 Tax=Tunturiibacter psychrotolerans TaxID=3069686 RepID=UPI003D1A7A55